MDRNTALQIREREGVLTIATVGGADQVEQCIIFRNGYQSSITECPTCGREIPCKHPDLTYKRTRHLSSPILLQGHSREGNDPRFHRELRYCTLITTVVVAWSVGVAAVTVTGKLPAGVPRTPAVPPHPAKASTVSRPARQSARRRRFCLRFFPAKSIPSKPKSGRSMAA